MVYCGDTTHETKAKSIRYMCISVYKIQRAKKMEPSLWLVWGASLTCSHSEDSSELCDPFPRIPNICARAIEQYWNTPLAFASRSRA
jgi:hypothetical protein